MSTKIAFLCLAHNNFEYLAQLSHHYCSDGDGFFLHIDNQSDALSIKGLHPETILLGDGERYRTRWGTINIARASLKLLEKALLNEQYDRFILVSGADTPLTSKQSLKDKLTADKSYLSVWGSTSKNSDDKLHDEFFKRHFYFSSLTNPGEAYLTKSKYKIYLMLILNKMIKLLPLKNNFCYTTYAKGSQWWCLTRELANHVVSELKNNKRLSQFQKMHAPDEKVFQTVALNSPLKNKIIIDEGQEQLKQGLHYIDWGFNKTKPGLQSFTLNDIEKAKELGCYFARKVDNKNIPYFINYIKQLKSV